MGGGSRSGRFGDFEHEDRQGTQSPTRQLTYNTLLAQADEAKNLFDEAETWIADLTSRMLAAAAAKFGRDSNEYEQAGGRKTSDRRRATRVARIEEIPAAKAA